MHLDKLLGEEEFPAAVNEERCSTDSALLSSPRWVHIVVAEPEVLPQKINTVSWLMKKQFVSVLNLKQSAVPA